MNLSHKILYLFLTFLFKASIAQLGERKTEDLKAPCSIHGRSIRFAQGDYDSDLDGFLQHQCQLWMRILQYFDGFVDHGISILFIIE